MYLKKKSIAGRISRVLYPLFRRASTIYLGRRSPAQLVSNLPPDIGRATLQLPVYMVLQPARRTDRNVSPLPRWALTPPFHPYRPIRDGGRSLLRCYPLARIFPLGSAALCVARTFLPSRFTNRSEFRFSGAAVEPPCYADGKGNHSCGPAPNYPAVGRKYFLWKFGFPKSNRTYTLQHSRAQSSPESGNTETPLPNRQRSCKLPVRRHIERNTNAALSVASISDAQVPDGLFPQLELGERLAL